MIKIIAPNAAQRVIDRAIQVFFFFSIQFFFQSPIIFFLNSLSFLSLPKVHGGAGVSQDFLLAYAYAGIRTLRLADGPDEVHRLTVAKLEIRDNLKKWKLQGKL